MAPALTEPLSSAEKLTSSTASAAPSTRSTRKYDNVSTIYTGRLASSSSITEKPNNSSVTKPSTSRRITRSKDAYQRVFERAVTDTGAPQSPPHRNNCQRRVSDNNNEQMGLSATNSNKKNNINNNNNNNNNTSNLSDEVLGCKDNTTEQLLADLTNDFEEAITADICLRKQLLNSQLAINNSEAAKGDLRDIVVIKGGSDSSAAADHRTPLPMESHDIGQALTNDSIIEVGDEDSQHHYGVKESANDDVEFTEELPKKPLDYLSKRPQIISVEELPPVSTDSTMTASEIEDNLEERLSQLDGGEVPTTSSHITEVTILPQNTKTASYISPAKVPAVQQMHQDFQQQQQQIPLQCQQVPTQFLVNNTVPNITPIQGAQIGQSIPNSGPSGGAGDELQDQDIEEVLKALKGFDGTASADTLCDLNVLFNEVYTTLNYEDINNQQAMASAKPSPLQEMRMEIERIQLSMQRKTDFLLRRMRKMQARYMCRHASEEIAGIFEWCTRIANKNRGGNTLSGDMQTKSAVTVISARPPASHWDREKQTPVSSAQVCALLRKLENAANSQQICNNPNSSWSSVNNNHMRKSRKGHQTDVYGGATNSQNIRKSDVVVPTLDSNVVEEMKQVTGLLQTEMRKVQTALDSDATESSSGCESADEMVIYNNQSQKPLPIAKRSAWRYSRDRAAIASRWSWLLTQISDLEIKIRQHNDLHMELTRKKGIVRADVDVAMKSPETAAQESMNGLKTEMMPPLVVSDSSSKEESGTEGPSGSCRTRGISMAQFRKRKLLQTTNIHTISKKAARPSTIKCGCQWPLNPCAVCTGRSDPTAPRDLPDTMMKRDRVALLDPGYHPILSFPDDASNSIHFEAIAKLPEWQHRVTRLQPKSIAKHVMKAEREAAAAAGLHLPKKYGGDLLTKRRYIKKKDRHLDDKEHNASMHSAAGGNSGTEGDYSHGNGTGSFSTTTTPLVANKLSKSMKRIYSQPMGSEMNLEGNAAVTPSASGSHHPHNNTHSASDFHQQSNDQYNHSQAHSSLISSNHSSTKNNKFRKYSMSTANAFNNYPHNYHHNNHHMHHNNHQHTHQNSNASSDGNFMHSNDNWDSFGVRSRTSSPTHGVSSNYHKYERSLDRKNRISYDIDNIVIPYSVAAATRVEILPYKEIPTPKWRVISDEKSQNDATCSEDRSEEAEVQKQIGNGPENPEKDCALQVATQANSNEPAEAETNESNKPEHVNVNKEKVTDEEVKEGEEAVVKKNNVLNEVIDDKEPPETQKELMHSSQSHLDEDSNAKENPPNVNNNRVQQKDDQEEPTIKKQKIESTKDTNCNPGANAGFKDLGRSSSPWEMTESTAIVKQVDKEAIVEQYVREDISDEAMIHRHERALTEERRKFQTFLKFPWSTRSRANRRIDSRAESSGANTPDPASPAPQTPGTGGDQESVPSPLAPSTPLNPMDNTAELSEEKQQVPGTSQSNCSSLNYFNKRHERRRTTSTKKELERRSISPDPRELIPPYEPLKFPLTDEVFDVLVQAMPNSCQDDPKAVEDTHLPMSVKLMRQKSVNTKFDSNLRRSLAKSTVNCDLNNKRLRHNNFSNHPKGVDTVNMIVVSGEVNHKTAEDSADNEFAYENGIYGQDDDDGFPKHHLAPNDDYDFSPGMDDEYEAYVGERSLLDSENDSSDTEPFQEDDPNDPEWKGGSEDRIEKSRKRI